MKREILLSAIAVALLGGPARGVDLSGLTKGLSLSTKADLSGSGIPQKDIDSWVTSWEDPESGSKAHFRASFGIDRVAIRNKSKYVRSGTIPIRITGDVIETRVSNGRSTRRRITNGTATVVILDPDGKKIASQAISLSKLCPT